MKDSPDNEERKVNIMIGRWELEKAKEIFGNRNVTWLIQKNEVTRRKASGNGNGNGREREFSKMNEEISKEQRDWEIEYGI